MRKDHGLVAWIAVLTMTAAVGWSMPVEDLYAVFKEDRTAAYRTYLGKEITVTGKLTAQRRETRGLLLVLDNKVAALVDRKSEFIEQIKTTMDAAEEMEEERVDKAKDWEKNYKQRYRKMGGVQGGKRMERYDDEMNRFGPAEESLEFMVDVTGICERVRGGFIRITPVSSVLIAPLGMDAKSKGARKVANAAAAEAAAEALKKKDWKLTGIIYVENGQRYFAPDKNQFGVDVWSLGLPPRVGTMAVTPALNAKRGTVEATFEPALRGQKSIKPENVKVSGLTVNE